MDIYYETFGSPSDPALLLVIGFKAQLTIWAVEFCQQLAEGGRYVIRFDNRDAGLSTHLDGVPAPTSADSMAAAKAHEEPPPAPYTLSDMAADCIGLLDALGIEKAHIAGSSLGGFIVQTMAIEHPSRVLSMTSIMSSTGEIGVGASDPSVMDYLLKPPPTNREEFIAAAPDAAGWTSKKYFDPEAARARAARDYDRAFYPEGATRQAAAVVASGSRAEQLPNLEMPVMVIHGRDDTMIGADGGFRTAELVPGSVLVYVSDMGHDIPPGVWPVVVPAILLNTNR